MHTRVKCVENMEEARSTIDYFVKAGYNHSSIYVLALDEKMEDEVTDLTPVKEVGIVEEGIFHTLAHLFRSKGSELRAKMRSFGIAAEHSQLLKEEMDLGRIVIIGWGGNLNFDHKEREQGMILSSESNV